MSINFPNSPITGQLYTFGETTWQWSGEYWNVYSAQTGYITSVSNAGNGYPVIDSVTSNSLTLKSFSGTNVSITDSGGQLNFYVPLNGGGGGQLYYFNISKTQTPYLELATSATTDTEQTLSTSVSSGVTATIGQFLTPSGFPGVSIIPGGVWSFYLHAYKQNSSASFDIYCDVYKRTTGGTETLLLSTDPVPITANSPTPLMFLSDAYYSGTTLNTTDRLLVNVRVTNTSNNTYSVTFVSEGSLHYSYMSSPLLLKITDIYVNSFTYTPSANTITIGQTESYPPQTIQIDRFSGLTIDGGLSANTISGGTLYGNGSNLTNVQNIYNNNGTLTGNRSLNGSNYSLTFNNLSSLNTLSSGIDLNFTNNTYSLGSFGGTGATYFIATPNNSTIGTIYGGSFNGFKFSFLGGQYEIGRMNGGNNTYMIIKDNDNVIETNNNFTQKGLKLNFATSGYSLGDYNNTNNGTFLTVNDAAGKIQISNVSTSITDPNVLTITNSGEINKYPISGLTNYLPLSGGTVTGGAIFQSGLTATTISGGTLFGDGSNLTGIVNIYNSDGFLTGNRTLNLSGRTLDIQTSGGTSRFFANGRVGIGTTTDSGFKFDVNGTSRLNGDIIFGGTNNYFNLSNALLYYRGTSSGYGLAIVPTNTVNTNNHNFTAVDVMGSVYGTITYITGNNTFNNLGISPTLNTSGGINLVRGVYFAPVINGLTGTTIVGFQNTIGDNLFNSTSGNTGIGLSGTPTNKLHVSASTDPVRFEGLQLNNTDTRILTSDSNGVVRYRNFTDFTGGTGGGGGGSITSFAYNNANTFTISDTGQTFNATINTVTGLTVNGNLSTTTLNATSNISGLTLVSTQSSGDEGGEIRLSTSQTNNSLSGGSVTIDVFGNRVRIFETGSPNKGVYIDLNTAGSGVGTNLLTRSRSVAEKIFLSQNFG